MKDMTETTIKKSKARLILLAILCIVVLVGASLAFMLRNGITLRGFTFASVHAEQIALRFDNGLIIAINRLEISGKQAVPSLSNPELLISRFNTWAHLFREIRINAIYYRGNIYTLLFNDNRFTVSGDDFQLAATLSYGDDVVHLEIANLALKTYDAALTGKAAYSPKNDIFTFNGRFAGFGVNSDISIKQQQNMLAAELQTDHFIDLAGPLAQLAIDQEVVLWIRENITARDYRINQLHLEFSVNENGLHIQPMSVYGSGIAVDSAIRFAPSLPPVRCSQINVSFKNDRLSFDLVSPTYQSKDLAGSKVTLEPVLGDNSRLVITLQTESSLDNEIHELLKTYGVQLPLTQQTGAIKVNLQLAFDLPDFTLHTNGRFTIDKARWGCKTISFQSDSVTVQLQDNLITLDAAAIRYHDLLEGSVSGTIDTKTGLATLNADIKQLDLRNKETNIVHLDNLSTPITARFNDHDIHLQLEKLRTDISITSTQSLLIMHDLRLIKPYIPSLPEFPLRQGKLNIDFTNPENLVFDGSINTDVIPFSLHNQPVTEFTFHGSKSGEKLTAIINDGKISLTLSDTLNIQLFDYLVMVEVETLGKRVGPSPPLPIVISGPNSLIKLKKISLPTKAFKAELTGAEFTFTANLEQGIILFTANSGEMNLAATKIDARIAQDFFPFADLQGGSFDLSLKGKNKENVEGFVEFSNVLIKDAALLNNVLSFINAIPALATLSAPGFDTDGYRVKEGVSHFTLNNNLLTLRQFRTDGTTINMEAEGWLDMENNSMKMEVELISLKDYSKIIGMIPWAGYAILGENGSLSTSLHITGSMEEPKITTNLPTEIVMIPVNMVKRAIKWPFHLFGKIRDFSTETPATGE